LGYVFQGWIDEVIRWNEELGDGDVTTLYAAGAPHRRTATGNYITPCMSFGLALPATSNLIFTAEDSIPTGTTLDYHIQYTADGVNFGVNAPAYDDTLFNVIENGASITGDGVMMGCKIRGDFASDADQLYTPFIYSLIVETTPPTRRISEIRIFCPATGAIKTFKVSYWSENAWVDITPAKLIGYNENRTPTPAPTNAAEIITTNAKENIIQFTEIETARLKLSVTETLDGEAAAICEVEAYRVYDASSDYQGHTTDGSVEPNQNRYGGRTFILSLWNKQKRYSPSYKPTPSEIRNGYFNSELLPNIGVRIWTGFVVSGADEVVQAIEGIVDTIAAKASSQFCTISGRDKMKLINLFPLAVDEDAVVSKTIENCLKYIFNFANVPSTELFLPTTGITLDTFFTTERAVWDIAQELTDSISDSFLYIDETGIITVVRLTNARWCIETTKDDFNAGEKTLWVNVNVNDEPGAIITEIEGGNILNGDMETRVIGSEIIDGLQYWTIYPTSNGYYGFHYNTSGPLEGPHG